MKTGGTHWDETRCSMDSWCLDRVKPVLLYSVDRALVAVKINAGSCFCTGHKIG